MLQGSVLGPLLFLIFINEIANQVSIGSQISLFADDIALYRPILNDADYCALQSDVSAIVSWINNSLLSLQPAKCCSILFTRKRNSKLLPPCITVEGTPLAIVSSVKHLGLQINSDLSWSPHVAKLCVKARKLVGLLYRRFGKLADTATLLQLYKSFIRPNLEYCSEYCSVVWDPYHVGDIELLEKVQRFALRVCLKNWSYDREELYIQSKIPALAQRRSCARLHHIFKIANLLVDFPEPHSSTGSSTTTIDIPILCSSEASQQGLPSFRIHFSRALYPSGTPCPLALLHLPHFLILLLTYQIEHIFFFFGFMFNLAIMLLMLPLYYIQKLL